MFTNEETKANAQAVLDYIIQHPEKHRQAEYFGSYSDEACGTTMCIAGTHLFLKHGADAERMFNNEVSFFVHQAACDLGISDNRWVLFHEESEDTALDKLNALAQGDLDKFIEIHETRGKEIE